MCQRQSSTRKPALLENRNWTIEGTGNWKLEIRTPDCGSGAGTFKAGMSFTFSEIGIMDMAPIPDLPKMETGNWKIETAEQLCGRRRGNETGMSIRMSMIHSTAPASNPDLRGAWVSLSADEAELGARRERKGEARKQTQTNPLDLSVVEPDRYDISHQNKPIVVNSSSFMGLRRKKADFWRKMNGAQLTAPDLEGAEAGNSRLETRNWKFESGNSKMETWINGNPGRGVSGQRQVGSCRE